MIQQEGPGWRLARDTSRSIFPYLIGGENWAIELTKDEWEIFFNLINDLIDHHKQLADQLMPEEQIFIELERDPWWAALDGDRNYWKLQIVLSSKYSANRGVEAEWPIPAAQAMATAMRTMWDSYQ